MKKTLLLSILAVQFTLSAENDINITKAEQITYDWLVSTGELTAYTDHIPHFREVFKRLKVRTFLEFGVGFSTKYFLDHCNKVISVEFVTPGCGPEWFKKCLSLYRDDYSNWIPIVFFTGQLTDVNWPPYKYFGSESVYKAAAYQSSTHKNYALIDDFYLKELDAFISRLAQSHQIDVAFVDPGIYLRGDLVQLLFGKVPVILAHDTTQRALGMELEVYGYSRIVTPEDYEEIFIGKGAGTTAWIIKNEKFMHLIEALKKYAQELIQ